MMCHHFLIKSKNGCVRTCADIFLGRKINMINLMHWNSHVFTLWIIIHGHFTLFISKIIWLELRPNIHKELITQLPVYFRSTSGKTFLTDSRVRSRKTVVSHHSFFTNWRNNSIWRGSQHKQNANVWRYTWTNQNAGMHQPIRMQNSNRSPVCLIFHLDVFAYKVDLSTRFPLP